MVGDQHMAIRNADVDMAGLQRRAVLGGDRGQRAAPV